MMLEEVKHKADLEKRVLYHPAVKNDKNAQRNVMGCQWHVRDGKGVLLQGKEQPRQTRLDRGKHPCRLLH
jgi:hypothetical protein